MLYIFLLFALAVCNQNLYDHQKSTVQMLTRLNFDKIVTKTRSSSKLVQIVHFYKPNDYGSREFVKVFEELANDYQGVYKILAINCATENQICEKEKVKQFPLVRIYPPQPMPTYDYEGDLESKKILKAASNYLQSNVIEVTSANIDTFLKEAPSVPKVLLFTDKTGTPTIYKGLSLQFEQKLFFGIVRSSEEDLIEKYKVKQTPTILVVKISEKQPKVYDGEMKFKPIFEFLNIYSEAFVAGGGSSQDTAATKIWLTEIVPQLTKQSGNDICFQQEGALCAILFSKDKPNQEHIDNMKQVHRKYQPKISRGVQYKFMWIDANVEKNWDQAFKLEDYPQLIILNPGRRKRFFLHEGDLSYASIEQSIEKIIGGDARFVAIKEIPEFV